MSALFEPTALVVPFEKLRMTDVEAVGGKNASLGEMISQLPQGVRVPTGFATTAHAFRQFLAHDGLAERISQRLATLDIDDVRALAEAGAEIRGWMEAQPFPADLEQAIRSAFATLQGGNAEASFAVRSSATAEDLPDASFAGQQETFLNVVGIEQVLHKMKEVFASLYNDRAISYRVHKGFAHDVVALSAGVQRMVRSDLGAAGVMFTIDTESGFDQVVFITSSYGLGETVVQGAVNPDEFYVHKPMLQAGKKALIRRNLGSKLIQMVFATPEEKAADGKLVKTIDVPTEQRNRYSLTDDDVLELARYALVIEQHYGRPMDIEWGKDGGAGQRARGATRRRCGGRRQRRRPAHGGARRGDEPDESQGAGVLPGLSAAVCRPGPRRHGAPDHAAGPGVHAGDAAGVWRHCLLLGGVWRAAAALGKGAAAAQPCGRPGVSGPGAAAGHGPALIPDLIAVSA